MKLKRKDAQSESCFNLEEWSYGKNKWGVWFVMFPGDLLGCLQNHCVVEHEDGTITVSPSILVKNSDISVHGFIEKGIWRDC